MQTPYCGTLSDLKRQFVIQDTYLSQCCCDLLELLFGQSSKINASYLGGKCRVKLLDSNGFKGIIA